MRTGRKVISLFFVAFFLTMPLLIPSMTTNAQTTSHYGAKIGDSGANLIGFDLTINSPISQKVYTDSLPFDFQLHWSPVGVSTFFNWTFVGLYTYSIDHKTPVSIESNQSESDIYGNGSNFKYNPSFTYLLDISDLTNGKHVFVISAGLYYNMSGQLSQLYNESSSPLQFLVQNPAPSPTSKVPEFPTFVILPLFAIVILLSIVFLRKVEINDSGIPRFCFSSQVFSE
jgi:hypothetical protein